PPVCYRLLVGLSPALGRSVSFMIEHIVAESRRMLTFYFGFLLGNSPEKTDGALQLCGRSDSLIFQDDRERDSLNFILLLQSRDHAEIFQRGGVALYLAVGCQLAQ